jgi:hypothetical protein
MSFYFILDKSSSLTLACVPSTFCCQKQLLGAAVEFKAWWYVPGCNFSPCSIRTGGAPSLLSSLWKLGWSLLSFFSGNFCLSGLEGLLLVYTISVQKNLVPRTILNQGVLKWEVIIKLGINNYASVAQSLFSLHAFCIYLKHSYCACFFCSRDFRG